MVSISVQVCNSDFNVRIENVKISGGNFQIIEKVNKFLTFSTNFTSKFTTNVILAFIKGLYNTSREIVVINIILLFSKLIIELALWIKLITANRYYVYRIL